MGLVAARTRGVGPRYKEGCLRPCDIAELGTITLCVLGDVAGGNTPLQPPVFRDVILAAIRARSVPSAHTLRHLRSRAPPYCSLRAYACRLRYLFLSGPDPAGTPTKLRASRKPRLPLRHVGTIPWRHADRHRPNDPASIRALPSPRKARRFLSTTSAPFERLWSRSDNRR